MKIQLKLNIENPIEIEHLHLLRQLPNMLHSFGNHLGKHLLAIMPKLEITITRTLGNNFNSCPWKKWCKKVLNQSGWHTQCT